MHGVRQQCATILEPTNSLLRNIGARIVINRGSFIRASLDIDESDPTLCVYVTRAISQYYYTRASAEYSTRALELVPSHELPTN